MTISIIFLIVLNCMSLAVNLALLYMVYRSTLSIKRLVTFGNTAADIQHMLKEAIKEHHTLIEQAIIDSNQDVIRHVTYTNRWQKVMAKMIRVGQSTPLEKATGSETLREAEELHEIGLDIAKVAFEDKEALEPGDDPAAAKDEPRP